MESYTIYEYMDKLGAQVVAKSGIDTDRYHLGKLLYESFQEEPDFISQIDGATNQSETNASILDRTVRCAVAFQKLGLCRGDVIVIIGPNHIDLCVPLYAALYLGIAVAGVDAALGVSELGQSFNIRKPNIIFCQSDKTSVIEEALTQYDLKSLIVTYNKGTNHCTLKDFLNNVDQAAKDFKPADFDTSDTVAYLTSTSGSTGLPKAAILTHKNLCVSFLNFWIYLSKFPKPTKMVLLLAPCQWLTAGGNYLFTPLAKITRLQTSLPITPEHFGRLLKTYKPTLTMSSPLLLNSLLDRRDVCDFSCFKYIGVGGSDVTQEVVDKIRNEAKNVKIYGLYGTSEVGGVIFLEDYQDSSRGYYCVAKGLEYRLVDPTTNEEITKANVPGEMLCRGPQVFKGYYNDPEKTAAAFSDGWFKTGDKFYRNDEGRYFYVERYKALLKYKSHQISPTEVEDVIKKHPGVQDVIVVGIPDKECGDLVVACVIPKHGTTVQAQEIKDLVKDSLADSKQLRGGVTFWNEWPTTSTFKIDKQRILKLVTSMERE